MRKLLVGLIIPNVHVFCSLLMPRGTLTPVPASRTSQPRHHPDLPVSFRSTHYLPGNKQGGGGARLIIGNIIRSNGILVSRPT